MKTVSNVKTTIALYNTSNVPQLAYSHKGLEIAMMKQTSLNNLICFNGIFFSTSEHKLY